jgi:hypothetical protein
VDCNWNYSNSTWRRKLKTIRSKIQDIINEIEKSQSSNVVSIGWNAPKDIGVNVDKVNQERNN